MMAELVLSVLQGSDDARGHVAGFAVTDQMIVAVGGRSDRSPIVMASSDARHFELRTTPRNLGLRDVLAVGDSLWACGESGQLAVSRDHGGHWQLLETGTQGCLFALTLGSDGALWVVGEAGYVARVLGEQPRQIDVGTSARLSSVHAVRDELVMLGGDGMVLRWRDGKPVAVACGTTKPLTALAITSKGTWVVVGDGGFVARSPDGTWYSRVHTGVDVDLEAIGVLPDGTLAIVGDRGQLLLSTDDARTWRGLTNDLGLVRLWSIERFGSGVLIGGDGGLIARLAPPDDATWRDRTNVFGGAELPGDVFAAGPDGLRANDRDPRRADQRKMEAEHPARADAAHRAERDAELERTPRAQWSDLAWQWLEDGIAHRALVSRLDRTDPTQAEQIAAIDQLCDASSDDRAIALPRLAGELSPELEAVLVGSLVRDDKLEGVLVGPRDAGAHDDDGESPLGWDAVDRALAPRYGNPKSPDPQLAERLVAEDNTRRVANDDDDAPDPARIAAALAMTERGLRLAPDDGDLQFTHAMLLLDAERAGDPAKVGELFALLSTFVPPVRINIAVRMGRAGHPRFGDAVELVLGEARPEWMLGGATPLAGEGAELASFGDVAHELFGELGEAILEHSPQHFDKLVPLLPDDAKLLSELAQQAIEAHAREAALTLYDRVLALPIPDQGDERTVYLRALNNACVQAHAAQALDAAVRIADRAQPVAHEHPQLYHAAACAYAAVHDYVRAFEQVKLAVEHGYDHVAKLEADAELGPLLEWPELKALFRDWHARREGN